MLAQVSPESKKAARQNWQSLPPKERDKLALDVLEQASYNMTDAVQALRNSVSSNSLMSVRQCQNIIEDAYRRSTAR